MRQAGLVFFQFIPHDISAVSDETISIDKLFALFFFTFYYCSSKLKKVYRIPLFFFFANQPEFGFVSKNPVLKNITDYLVDEGSFEEDELIGT